MSASKVWLLASILAIANPEPSAATEPGVWTTGGPYGAHVTSIAIDPTSPGHVLVGTFYSGAFRTTDGGASWTAVSNGTAYRTVSSVHIDPSTPSTQYLTNSGMLFKTMNEGATWDSLGFPAYSIGSFLLDPVTPTNLHAISNKQGLIRSTDAGKTWAGSPVPGPFGSSAPLALSSSAILAGSYGSGLRRSTDAGVTWDAGGAGLPADDSKVLASSPSDPQMFFAARGSRVFRSTDAGATFTETNAGLPDLSAFSVASIAVSGTSPAIVLMGLRQDYGPAPTFCVFRSSDAGTSWAASSEGLHAERLSALAFDPSNPDKVWAASVDAGLFTSTNGGRSWAAAGTRGFAGEHTRRLALSPAAPGRVLAAAESKLFRSSDSGRSWGATSAAVSEAIAADPRDPAVLYAAAREEGILKSTDGGDSWTRTSLGLRHQSTLVIAVDPVTTANVYVGTWQGVHKSRDAGASWTKIPFPFPETDIQRLVIDPASPETLFVTTGEQGVHKSTDAGATWTRTMQGPTYVSHLVLCPSRPSTLYASGGTSILRSTNSGSSWESRGPLPKGLSPYTPAVRALAVDPVDPSLLYAGAFVNTGTEERALFRSTDGGLTWRVADAGLPPDATVDDLAVEPDTGNVYAALYGRGVFRMTRASEVFRLVVPAAARAEGLGYAFYTTDLTVANTGSTPALYSLELADGDTDRGEPRSFSLAPGASRTFEDVLSSVFERSRGVGAIRITTSSAFLRALSQTSTPGFGGTLGHSVPATRDEDLVVYGKPRSLLAVRENGAFRTNLILANAREESLEVNLALVDASGETRGEKRVALPPLGMTQLFRVVRDLGVEADLAGARLVVSAATLGGAFAAYAVAIDNVTNDPRTLLPVQILGTVIEPSWPPPPPNHWTLPAGARSHGPGGAFYKTDATVAYLGGREARFTLKFLGHDTDGQSGVEVPFLLGPRKAVSYSDVLGSVFKRVVDFGGLRVSSLASISDSAFLAATSETWTPGFGGTFGQSVPAALPRDLVRFGTPQSILAVREDEAFRTNLILTNTTESALEVDVTLVSEEGTALANRRYPLPPLGMVQVGRVVRDLGIATDVKGARLVLSTPTTDGAFAAYASVIDNVTNDPRTLLPR